MEHSEDCVDRNRPENGNSPSTALCECTRTVSPGSAKSGNPWKTCCFECQDSKEHPGNYNNKRSHSVACWDRKKKDKVCKFCKLRSQAPGPYDTCCLSCAAANEAPEGGALDVSKVPHDKDCWKRFLKKNAIKCKASGRTNNCGRLQNCEMRPDKGYPWTTCCRNCATEGKDSHSIDCDLRNGKIADFFLPALGTLKGTLKAALSKCSNKWYYLGIPVLAVALYKPLEYAYRYFYPESKPLLSEKTLYYGAGGALAVGAGAAWYFNLPKKIWNLFTGSETIAKEDSPELESNDTGAIVAPGSATAKKAKSKTRSKKTPPPSSSNTGLIIGLCVVVILIALLFAYLYFGRAEEEEDEYDIENPRRRSE